MQVSSSRGRFAERVLPAIDDEGREERVAIWIERRTGGVWAVGRSAGAVNHHGSVRPRDETLFEGYELADALDRANEALEDELAATARDDHDCKPFTRNELLKPLERWFFGR